MRLGAGQKGEPSEKLLSSQLNVLGSCTHWESEDLLELSSSVPELRVVLTKGFCLPCGVCVGYTQMGTLPPCLGSACGRSMWCWQGFLRQLLNAH